MAGIPRIAFNDGDLGIYYATRNGASWTYETIYENSWFVDFYWGVGLALNGTTPHVAFRRFSKQIGGNDYLMYATKTGSNWVVEDVEYLPGGEYARGPYEVGVGSGGVWIGYKVEGGASADQIRVAHKTGATWAIEVVASFPAYSTFGGLDLAMGSDGQPRVVYGHTNTNRFFFASRSASGVWSVKEVPVGPGEGSLIIDAAGLPHISVRNGLVLKYAWLDATDNWHIETVDSNAGPHDIGLDASGRPVIAYENHGKSDHLYFAVRQSAGVWQLEDAETQLGASATTVDLAMHGNTPHISYRDYNTQLRYATVP